MASTSEKQADIEKTDDQGHFTRLGTILSSYLEFDESDDVIKTQNRIPRSDRNLAVLRFLRPVPWFLSALFLFSFFWDFNGVSGTILGLNLSFEGLLRIVSVSGMIGFLTNWIAITMLFRPLKKRPLLGQGLIPANKERIAYRLATAVSDDLINPELIKLKIRESQAISYYRLQAIRHIENVSKRPDFRKDLKEWMLTYIHSLVHNPEFRKTVSGHIMEEIEDALHDRVLEKAALKTYSFLRGQSLEEFIEGLLERIPVTAERNIDTIENYLDEFPEKVHQNSEQLDELITLLLYKLINQLNVQALVEENLRKYDEKRLEQMIRNATNEQLKTIQYLGAVLGTIGGFVIWEPILSLAVLSITFGAIYLIDWKLYQ